MKLRQQFQFTDKKSMKQFRETTANPKLVNKTRRLGQQKDRKKVHNLLFGRKLFVEYALSKIDKSDVIKVELLARYVLGWKRGCELLQKNFIRNSYRPPALGWFSQTGQGRTWCISAASYWNPAQDSESASYLIDKLTREGYMMSFSRYSDGYQCELTDPNGTIEFGYAQTWNRAFCIAILKLYPNLPSNPVILLELEKATERRGRNAKGREEDRKAKRRTPRIFNPEPKEPRGLCSP